MAGDVWPDSLIKLLELTKDCSSKVEVRRHRTQLLIDELLPNLTDISIIKVAGTNGKGSVCAMLQAALNRDGKKVGVFTSPHLFMVNERIRFDEQLIGDDSLNRLAIAAYPELESFVEKHTHLYKPSFFEVLLLLAFRYFQDNQADFAVIEAGIGGYYDSVSLLPGVISTITSVGIDHVQELGNTLEAIANDKAAIASTGTPLVLGPKISSQLVDVIQTCTCIDKVEVVLALTDKMRLKDSSIEGTIINVDNTEIKLSLLGPHQIENFATVKAIIERLNLLGLVGDLAAIKGVESASWPGRLEYVPGSPKIIYDIAHNRDAFAALLDAIDPLVDQENIVVLFGASQGKDYHSYLDLLHQLGSKLYVVEGFNKALSTATLVSDVKACEQFSSVENAMNVLSKDAFADKTLLVVGSIYLVGAVKAHLNKVISPVHKWLRQ